jgi:hypothetical protein
VNPKQYYLYQTSCLTSCPIATYYDSLGDKCIDCSTRYLRLLFFLLYIFFYLLKRCETCFGVTNSDCNSCRAGFYLTQTTCDVTCPGGTYPNSNTKS